MAARAARCGGLRDEVLAGLCDSGTAVDWLRPARGGSSRATDRATGRLLSPCPSPPRPPPRLLAMNSLITKPVLRSSRLLVASQRAFVTGALQRPRRVLPPVAGC